MALISDAVTTWLLSKSSVTSLLKNTTRSIFTEKSQLGAKRPFIYVELASNIIDYTASTQIALAEASIRLHCESTSRTTSANIAEAIRILFVTPLQETLSTLPVRFGRITDIRDSTSAMIGGDEKGLINVICDLDIHYEMPAS